MQHKYRYKSTQFSFVIKIYMQLIDIAMLQLEIFTFNLASEPIPTHTHHLSDTLTHRHTPTHIHTHTQIGGGLGWERRGLIYGAINVWWTARQEIELCFKQHGLIFAECTNRTTYTGREWEPSFGKLPKAEATAKISRFCLSTYASLHCWNQS